MSTELPLVQRIRELPPAPDERAHLPAIAELVERVRAEPALAPSAPLLETAAVHGLLLRIFAGAPHLARTIEREPSWLLSALSESPEQGVAPLLDEISALMASPALAQSGRAELMRRLRRTKGQVALLIALADIAGAWGVAEVTRALSDLADRAVACAVRFLFLEATAKGLVEVDDPRAPEARSGYFVLAMGKHGARELNYSSDIDLIVFFAPDKLRVSGRHGPDTVCERLTRDLVAILQERTEHGYVFRTDLRLRPDAGATPIAVSTSAALNYYESYGQNWERAAMIKARVVAGDHAAGRAFLAQLAPYVWRKYLDYAAIADIHAMKRQIHAVKGFATIAVAGHNIKLGRGGIREIEFFVQTQQLIAGGRQHDLRAPDTLTTLTRLAGRGWITALVADEMAAAYLFLRHVEHRLQMQNDEQTHQLPSDAAALERFSRFAGFADTAGFSDVLVGHLKRVETHYNLLFEAVPTLTARGSNMMFAGEADDPQTVRLLRDLGYSQPSTVISCVRGWHHGRYRAVRSATARERLTELQPHLVEALAATAAPDAAFAAFDRFLAGLPSGVQLFALLGSNRKLLELIAAIVGTAPRLSMILSRRPRVLDGVLDPGFLGAQPTAEALDARITAELAGRADYEEVLDQARIVGAEQQFLIGVRVLTGAVPLPEIGLANARLATAMIRALQAEVEARMTRDHGIVEGGAAAVIAMGKLGGREMTASSDLDLIVIYDYPQGMPESQGRKPLLGPHYYGRLTQRLIGALAAPTAEGRLYEVDMRLRPSGQSGPLATELRSFVHYQRHDAWTWEHLALTRARVISGPAPLREAISDAIAGLLTLPRDRRRVAADVRAMRERMFTHNGSTDAWNIKHVRGGLIDVEFIAQHLQLVHAAERPDVLDTSTVGALRKLARHGALGAHAIDVLIPAAHLYQAVTQILRLCMTEASSPREAPEGLKSLLARACGEVDIVRLEAMLRETQQRVTALFEELIV